MDGMPTLRVTLEGMRYEVIHAFAAKQVEIREALEAELDRAIREFDWADVVQREANEALRRAVKRSVEDYFMWGQGRKLVDQVVAEIYGGIEKEK